MRIFLKTSIKSREILRECSLRLENAAWGLILSNSYIKQEYLDKANGITDIEVILEDRFDDLDLIALAEKLHNTLTTIANKVQGKEYRDRYRTQPEVQPRREKYCH